MIKNYGIYYKKYFTKLVINIDKKHGNGTINLGGLYEQN